MNWSMVSRSGCQAKANPHKIVQVLRWPDNSYESESKPCSLSGSKKYWSRYVLDLGLCLQNLLYQIDSRAWHLLVFCDNVSVSCKETDYCLPARSRSARKHTPVLAFGGWSSDWSIKAEPQFIFKMFCMKIWWLVFEILCLLGQSCWVQGIFGLSSLSYLCMCEERTSWFSEEGMSEKEKWPEQPLLSVNKSWSRKGGEWSGQAGLAKRNRHQGRREIVGLHSCIAQAYFVFNLKILSLI